MPNHYNTILAQFQKGIQQAQQKDPQYQQAGARQHMYQTIPVSNASIQALEQQLGWTLPDGLSTFLQTIGAGAGPGWGLLTPPQMLEALNIWQGYLQGASFYHQAFALSKTTAHTLLQQKQNTPQSYFAASLPHLGGLVPLATMGESYHFFLVIEGDLKDTVWQLDSDDFDVFPVGKEKIYSFLDWYQAWLEALDIDGL